MVHHFTYRNYELRHKNIIQWSFRSAKLELDANGTNGLTITLSANLIEWARQLVIIWMIFANTFGMLVFSLTCIVINMDDCFAAIFIFVIMDCGLYRNGNLFTDQRVHDWQNGSSHCVCRKKKNNTKTVKRKWSTVSILTDKWHIVPIGKRDALYVGIWIAVVTVNVRAYIQAILCNTFSFWKYFI